MRSTLTVSGIALLLALTGCTSVGASPSSGPPVVISTAAIAAAAEDSVYVAAARAGAPDLSNQLAFADIAAAGRQVCADLNAGTPISSVVARLAAPYGAKDADVLIGAAPDVLCARHDEAVDAAVKTPEP